ncbi:MAG: TonB-dependent receptor [Bacteroidota bacterium]
MYKNSAAKCGEATRRLPKLLLIMRLSFILCLLTFLQVSATSIAQKINIDKKDVSLRAVLNDIHRQSGYSVLYETELINQANNMDIHLKDASLEEALKQCFANQPFIYKVNQKTILVIPKPVMTQATTAKDLAAFTVSGLVTDAKGITLIGVTVKLKGTTTAVATGTDGKYNILLPDGTGTLVFSYVGFENQEIAIKGRNTINVTLVEETKSLNDVVVVGYGTQKKITLTSSVSQVSGEDINKRPVSNLQQSLQGLAAGVTVLDQGGAPGRSAATIRVRGVTTFNINNADADRGAFDLSKNDPLVIIDGIEQSLAFINPDDVESMTLLKDASSTAIYGSRATNGVILVTTKRAKTNKTIVTYNGYYGLQQAVNKPVFMDTEQYFRLEQAAYQNAGLTVPDKFTDAGINTWVNATDREKYPLPATWFNTVIKTAPQQNHNFAVAGGNDVFKTRLSTRFQQQDGIAANYVDKLGEIKLNSDFNPSKAISINADLDYRYNYSTTPAVEPWNNVLHGSLFAVPKYDDGTYGLSNQGNNPLMYAEKSGVFKQYDESLIANTKAIWTIIPGLQLSTQLGLRSNHTNQHNFTNAYTNFDKNTNITKTVSTNSLTEGRNTLREYTWNNLLTYEKNIDNHHFKGLAGYSVITNTRTFETAYRQGFYNNDLQSLNLGTNDGTKTNTGYDATFGLQSFFGRFNYNFADKYLFEVNGRYDGSSKFTGDKRYSFFPSFSAAWRISQEKFFSPLKDVVNDLKIRGSYGITGNQSVDLYSYYASLNAVPYDFGGTVVNGFRLTSLANQNLGWESTQQLDLGLDASFLNNHLDVTFDYYKKDTRDILLNLGIPATVGLNAPPQNAGSVRNTGYEFGINYRNKTDFGLGYSVSANFSINSNLVTDLKGTGPYIQSTGDSYGMFIIKTGLPINTLWGYKADGLFQTQAQVDAYPTYAANSKPGDVKYLDLNGDGKINADDMTNIGNTFPKYLYGFNGSLSFKNFDLYALFQGAADVDVRLSGALTEMGNQEGFVPDIYNNNFWTAANPDARFPRPIKFDLRNVKSSDRLVTDGSYLRLKNLQLGYTIPSSIIPSKILSKVRVYAQATNVLTFSKLNELHIDPEITSGTSNYYPQTSVYSFGLNVQF